MTARTKIILAESARDVAALIDSIDDADPTIRALALGALNKLDALTTAHAIHALADADRGVRVRAIELSVHDRSIDLVPLLDDADDLVVETAAWALGEREDDATTTVAALVSIAAEHDVSICREAAIAALGAIGSEDGLPAIIAGLDDRAPVRRRAVLALAPFDSPEVTNALERATQDRDRQVRQAAEDLL